MRPIRICVFDEISRYPASAGVEGDPIALATVRSDTFWNAVIFMVSTPTIAGQCRIEAAFNESDKNYWYCPCPKCKTFQTLKWTQVRWEKDKPETAVYVCESCKERLSDVQRAKMVSKGQWRPTAPFNGKRGYHLNGINTLFRHKKGYKNRLHQMAATFLSETKKGEESVKTLTNTFFAETFKPKTITISSGGLMERTENYGPELIPAPVLVLVATADLQMDRIEFHLVGFGAEEEAWALDYKVFPGNPHRLDVWTDVYNELNRVHRHANGHDMKCDIAFIDSGGQSGRVGFNKAVYRFVKMTMSARSLGAGIYASKGSNQKNAALRREIRQKTGIPLQYIGTDEAKSMLYARLAIKEPGPRFIHFPNNSRFDAEYFSQITAEELQITKHFGFDVRKWVKIRDRNEALDLWALAFAALDKLNPNWEKLAQRYAPTVKGPPAPASKNLFEVVKSVPKKRKHTPFKKRKR